MKKNVTNLAISKNQLLILILTLLLSAGKFNAQELKNENSLKKLAGYHYKEIVENADTLELGIPVIVTLPWMGSKPDWFEQYITGFKKPVRILLLQAPYPFKNGFSFFSITPKYYYELPLDEKMSELLNEGEKISKFIKVATELYKPNIKPVIIGASQGGDLSYVIGCRYGELISLACPLLGTMDERIVLPKHKTETPIVAFHGTADPIVPIKTARKHIKKLVENGFSAELKEFEGVEHKMPEQMKKEYLKTISSIIFDY